MSETAEATDAQTSGPWFNNATYNFLKFVAQILLPALGTLYGAVAGLWGLPAVLQVVGTIMAVDTFLGVILGISSAQFKATDAFKAANAEFDGVMTIHQYDDNNGMFELNFPDHPSTLMQKDKVVLRVEPVAASSEHAQRYTEPGDLPPVPPPT